MKQKENREIECIKKDREKRQTSWEINRKKDIFFVKSKLNPIDFLG